MVKVGYCALAAVAICFLLSIAGCPITQITGKIVQEIGQRIASEEKAQADAKFERDMQAAIDAGDVVRVVTPDGRVEYRNASLPEPSPADLPTSSK